MVSSICMYLHLLHMYRWHFVSQSNEIPKRIVKKYKEVESTLEALAVAEPDLDLLAVNASSRLDFGSIPLSKEQEKILNTLRFESQNYHLYISLIGTKVISAHMYIFTSRENLKK
jgi:hypothetical protein